MNDKPAGIQSETSAPETQTTQGESKSPKRPQHLGLWLSVGLAAVAILLQWAAPEFDHQLSNIFSFAAVVAAIVMLLIWWVSYFRRHPLVRFGPVLLIAICVAAFFIVFEYDGVSGELEPSFTLRFNSDTKELPSVTSQPVVAQIDESTTTRFSGFLGNRRDGSIARREFATDWQSDPPQLLFRQPIGAGWSGFAIAGSYGYTLEQRGEEEWTTCYHLDSGDLIWKHVENTRHENALGGVGPRSTPSLVGEYVIVQGATGILLCLQATDGKLVWRHDLLKLTDLNQLASEEIAPWGRSGSPLILDTLVVIPLGGSSPNVSALAAFDLADGTLRWQTYRKGEANDLQQTALLGRSQISYASPIVATLAGRRQIISVNESDVSGYDIQTGETLWSHDWPGNTNTGANCSQPVPVGDNQILVSKAYGGGGMLIEVAVNEDRFTTQKIWHITNLLKTKFSNLVTKQGFAYALSDGILECVELETGLRQWRQPRSGRYKHGQLLLVDDVILVLAEDGRVALVAAQPDAFEELASIQAIEGKTWSNPAIAGRRLVVRNADQAASFLLPAKNENQ